MNRSEILDGLSRRERGAIQSAQAHSANAARRQDWQRICDSYVATLTPVTDCSAVSTTEMPQHENIVTTPVLEFGDTSIPTFAPDSLLLGLQSQTSTPVIQPERTGFDYQTKNSHGLPGGMIGNFDRPPDVQARIEASNRAEVIGEAIDHPDMSGLSPEMRMAARINNAVRHIDQGIRNLSEGISHGVANISKGFSRARETFSSIWGRAKSPSHSPRSIADRRRRAIALVVGATLMSSCGVVRSVSDQDTSHTQVVTPAIPAEPLGIIPNVTDPNSLAEWPDLYANGKPLFGKLEATFVVENLKCKVALPKDLTHKIPSDLLLPTAVEDVDPVIIIRRNPAVPPPLGASLWLAFPIMHFKDGSEYKPDLIRWYPGVAPTSPYEPSCTAEGGYRNFTQSWKEVKNCVSVRGRLDAAYREQQYHLQCQPVDLPYGKSIATGSFVREAYLDGSDRNTGPKPMPVELPIATPATVPTKNFGVIFNSHALSCDYSVKPTPGDDGRRKADIGTETTWGFVYDAMEASDGQKVCLLSKPNGARPTTALLTKPDKNGVYAVTAVLSRPVDNRPLPQGVPDTCFKATSKPDLCPQPNSDNLVLK